MFPLSSTFLTVLDEYIGNKSSFPTYLELITAAQHNLRTPLTALRWQLENMRKSISDSGDANGLNRAIAESEESVERLTRVLEDFLSITEVRVGKNI